MSIKENQTVQDQGKGLCNTKKNQKRNRKFRSVSPRNSRRGPRIIHFTPVSAGIIFKTIILMAVLIVATVAMVYRITDAVVWTFLTMLSGYAALSNPHLPKIKKK